MKFKAGELWACRNGDGVRIYATDGKGSACVHGAVSSKFGWEIDSWLSDGRYMASGEESGWDLVTKLCEADGGANDKAG